jgi:hypothetical protein
MFHKNRHIFRLFSLFILFLSACFVAGEKGHISFDDANKYPIQMDMKVTWDDRTFNPNVGVGAEITFEPGKTLGGVFATQTHVDGATVYHAVVSDPDIFQILGNDSEEITLRAKKAGNIILTIESNDGLFDYIELTAVDIMELRLLVRSDRTYFTGWGFGEPFTEKGLAVMPGASFEAGIQPLDKDGKWLSGVLPMHWDGTNTAMVDSEFANAMSFETLGGDPQITALVNVDGEEIFLPLGIPEVVELEKLHLGIFNYMDFLGTHQMINIVNDTDTLVVEEGPVFRTIYLMDDEGHLVIPSEVGSIEVSVLQGPECLVQDNPNPIEGLAALNLTHFHACPGSGVIRISYLGVEREIMFEVTPTANSSDDLD